MKRNCEILRRLWATLFFARTHDEPQKSFPGKNFHRTLWKPTTFFFATGGDENVSNEAEDFSNESTEGEKIMSVLETVRLREEAVARCTAKNERKVVRKQARKARVEHLVRFSMEPEKEKATRKRTKPDPDGSKQI